MASGFTSESCPASARNRVRLHVGFTVRHQSESAVDQVAAKYPHLVGPVDDEMQALYPEVPNARGINGQAIAWLAGYQYEPDTLHWYDWPDG